MPDPAYLKRGEPKPEEASPPPVIAARVESKSERTPQLDWAELLRRTLVLDVFTCPWYGGRQQVLA